MSGTPLSTDSIGDQMLWLWTDVEEAQGHLRNPLTLVGGVVGLREAPDYSQAMLRLGSHDAQGRQIISIVSICVGWVCFVLW